LGKLYFRYGVMSSGKTAQLIGVATNYEIQGKQVLIFTAALDTRVEQNTVASRNGLRARSLSFEKNTDLYAEVFSSMSEDLHCVLVDEAHFLTAAQVIQLSSVADSLGIPVICFGLKNDFRNRLFEGAEYLLLHADSLEEIKTVCWFCNRKATMNLRLSKGQPVYEGEQLFIGGTESYLPVCRRCYHNPPLWKLKKKDPSGKPDARS
ncbi:MAG TPA: thymidine kinase, partial [Synergistaceae bacterium]|nr:thymidine kinase [Synergistaceae bacterium]